MSADELSEVLDDAFPACPSCGQQMQVAGDAYRPYLYCAACHVSAVVRPGA